MSKRQLITIDSMMPDSKIRWERYADGNGVIDKFSKEDWHKIASDIDSEEELRELLESFPHKIQAFVLYENGTNEAIGFIYLLKERRNYKTLSYHGGGWKRSIKFTYLYLRGTILMIEHILSQGYKVQTYCSIENSKAYKFMQSLGFVKYSIAESCIRQWINTKRLRNSLIYKKIFLQKS